jgi:hypothetical protein
LGIRRGSPHSRWAVDMGARDCWLWTAPAAWGISTSTKSELLIRWPGDVIVILIAVVIVLISAWVSGRVWGRYTVTEAKCKGKQRVKKEVSQSVGTSRRRR